MQYIHSDFSDLGGNKNLKRANENIMRKMVVYIGFEGNSGVQSKETRS